MKPSFFTFGTLLMVLATSLVVKADPTPPPAPTPTPPPECSGRSYFVNHADAKNGVNFNVSRAEAGEPASMMNCSSIEAVEGKRLKGTVRAQCLENGMGGASWSFQNNCTSEQAILQCRPVVSVGVSKTELFNAFSAGGTSAADIRGDLLAIPNGDASQGNIAKITITCRAIYQSDGSAANLTAQGFLASSLSNCRNTSSGLCYLDPYNGIKTKTYSGNDYEFAADGSYKPLVKAGKSIKQTILYVWNKSNTTRRLNGSDIQFMTRDRIDGSYPPTYVARDAHNVDSLDVAGVPTEATACDLRVSGVIGGYQATVPPSALVENDILVFTVNMKGGTGLGLVPPTITYSGGPNPLTGVWENPPANSTALVTATVETSVSKNKFSCQLKVDTRGSTSTVRLRRFGDCGYFDALRSHYFMDSSGKAFQNTGFKSGSTVIPGISARYGESSPEVPYSGVMNAAASNAGEIIIGSGGSVLMPPLKKRLYSKAIIVAKRFRSGGKVQDALFWGTMDLNDYSITRMSQVDSSMKLEDEDTVVFQAFVAATQPSKDFSRDLRGTGEGLPYYSFAPSTSEGRPFDKVIPFTNESCIPLFQAKPPLRADVKDPNPALTGVTQCLYSRPYTVGDIKNGRVDLTLMHLVPMHAHHQFPTELLKASSQPACVAKNPTNQIDCWDVKASSMGAAATSDPFASHDQCRTVTTTWVTQTASSTGEICSSSGSGCNREYSCRKVTTTSSTQVPVTTVTYKSSCAVLETKNECNANLAIRFSGYNQMMIAGLMCADKYKNDYPAGEQITATLFKQGIIPYTPSNDMGGSSPKAYSAYPAAYGSSKGVGCIPCRFGSDAIAAGRNLTADTEPLSVDQDSSSRRKPIFTFRRMKAPAECVRNVNFEVRYFGSAECNGVSKPAGHFCSSSNLGGQTCSATDGHGGGNVAASRTIPVCPNSGFEFDNVSVSWSPLLLDLGGTGIQISRDPSYALKFDIRGDGRQRLIDWPINTNEVAFLVMPNKDGKVLSGKELFGEYKAKNGFAALAKYDSNKDQKIDRQDKDYGKLRLWFDRNRNGVYDDGEGELLADHGVETIYLQHRKITDRGTDGRTLYSVYFNNKFNDFMNIADYYFNEYGVEKKSKK